MPSSFLSIRTAVSWAILIILSSPGGAQKLVFGVVAGGSLTDDVHHTSNTTTGIALPSGETFTTIYSIDPASRQFIIGPKLELRLPWNLSVEAEALHRTLHANQSLSESFSGSIPGFTYRFTQTLASWEFPILGRYRFQRSHLSPFVEFGPSLRPAGSGSLVTHWGVTAGAGIEWHSRGFHFTPEIRYTHWKGIGYNPVQVQDQVEFLVGVERGAESSGFASGFGKRFSAGLLAGVDLGDDLQTAGSGLTDFGRQRSEANSLIAGVLLEFAIHRDLYLEAEGIYRPLHARSLPSELGPGTRFAVLTWEFPVMAKYKFHAEHAWRPFVETGPAFRLDGNFNGPMPAHYGIAAGAGIEYRLCKLKLSPTVRYTHWAKERSPRGGGTFRNEVETLVGVSF